MIVRFIYGGNAFKDIQFTSKNIIIKKARPIWNGPFKIYESTS